MKARETMKFKTNAGNHGHSEKNAENQELATRVGELQIGGERGKVGIHLQAQRNKETGEKREKNIKQATSATSAKSHEYNDEHG